MSRWRGIVRRALRDRTAASVIEFAFALPVAVALVLGILQFALVLQASGAIRHAVGEGVRYANLHQDASQSAVATHVRAQMAGIDRAGIDAITLERGVSNGAQYDKVAIEYRLEPVVPFVELNPIVLSDSALSYVQS